MREAHRTNGTGRRMPHRTARGALNPYLLEDTAFTLEEIRRWRGQEAPA
jgi:hypothetical protein